MQIEYDSEADALYIRFRTETPTENVDVEDGLTIDLDEKRHLIGIEILHVSKRFPRETLNSVTVQNLLADAL